MACPKTASQILHEYRAAPASRPLRPRRDVARRHRSYGAQLGGTARRYGHPGPTLGRKRMHLPQVVRPRTAQIHVGQFIRFTNHAAKHRTNG